MIEILHYQTANKNKVIGFVDIMFPIVKPVNFIIRNIAHLQVDEKNWFNLPQICRETAEGKKLFLKLGQFEIEVYNNQLLANLSEPVKEYRKKNNIKQVEPLNFDEMVSSQPNELPF